MASGESEWGRSGPVVIAGTAGIMLSAVHSYSLGTMIGPLEREFGWSRSEISTGPLIVSLVAIVGAPLLGVAVDRFGPRRIALIGVPLFCAMLACFSLVTASVYSWWGLWAAMALCAMCVIPTLWTAPIAGAFSRHRGMALALALCGTSLCATVTPPLTSFLVQSVGWRSTYVGLATIYFLLVYPLVWLFLRNPGHRSAQGSADAPGHPVPLKGATLREGIRSPVFLKMAISLAAFSLALCALTTNAVPILIAQGLGASTAASIAGVIGLGSLAGRLGGGFLLDRVDAHRLSAASMMMPVLSVLILLAVPGSVTAALVAAAIMGLAAGTEVDACAYLAARHFGIRSFGALFGALNGILLFANGLAPLLSNLVYDATRSYGIFLWGCIPACSLAAVLLLFLGPYPDHEGA